MKPWEETWFADEGFVYVGEGRDRMTFFDPTPGPPADIESRARLASAAPELVRVLLTVEAASLASASACPVCRGPYVEDMRGGPYRASAGYVIDHAFDCALDAALRKAGVR